MNNRKLLVSVFLLVSVLLAACAPVATPPAPTVVPPTVAPTSAPTQEGLTTFSPKTFNLPITLSYGPEWRVAEEYSDVFTLSYIGHDAGVSFMNVKNAKYADGIAFPDDFVTWIKSPDSLFQVVDSKPVLVGGFTGIQINAIAACGDKKNWIMLSGTGWGCPGVEHIGFIYLADVYRERVLIQIQGSPDGKDYEFIVEESQKVLDTVVFSESTVFSSKIFKLPMSVSFGSNWHVIDDLTDLVTVQATKADWNLAFNIVTDAKVAGPVSGAQIPFPDDFASWIKSNPDFKADEPTEVTVAGLKGLQIDAVPMTTKQKDFLYYSAGKWNIIPSPEGWRFILLNDVNGERVLILLIAPAGQFKDAVEQAQKVLDTVVFSEPVSTAP